jgi:serine/threonine-protein kinase
MTDLRRWYEAAVEIAPNARAQWLTEHCADAALRAQVLAMLQADPQATSPLDRPAAERMAALGGDASPARAAQQWIGRRVGPFRLQSMIGEGGMAAVFRAAREGADFEQAVAVKLLKRAVFSEYEQRQFQREQQALASLEHPNIARLIDGGVTEEGMPYLAMELVDGETITRYCQQRRADLRARLNLFLTVCRAVDAAHQALIVHRDIKPSNILVTADGVVKLLDFGIAKMLNDEPDERTRTGMGALTPEYAAPEQFSGGTVTTATDAYALGVLLHELLIGVRPERLTGKRPSDLLLARGTQATTAFSQRALRGDLDNIVLKALEPEPGRRYSGARALAEDLERHLSGQPVLAHPPSRWYRAKKFVGRHRGGVLVSFVLGVAVLVSLALALWQARIAREHAERADTVRDFVVNLLRQTAPSGPASERPDVPTLVYEAAAELPVALQNQPEVRVELLATLGNVLRNMNDPRRSEALLRLAQQGLDEADIDDRVRIEVDIGLARTLNKMSRFDEAMGRLAPWLALPERRLPQTVRRATLLKLAMAIDASAGRTDDALRRGAEMIAAYERDCARGVACDELGYAQYDYGMTLVGAKRLAKAGELLHASLLSKRAARAPLPSVAESEFGLSLISGLLGELDAAETSARTAMTMQDSMGDSVRHPLRSAQQQLAEVLLAKEDYAQAQQQLTAIVDDYRQRNVEPCTVATVQLHLARADLALGQLDAGTRAADAARAGNAQCPRGNRLLIAETVELLLAQARLAAGDRDGARSALALSALNEVAARPAGPGRQALYLHEAMRLAVALDDAELTRASAQHLIALLDTIGASVDAPLRIEAELQQARAQGIDPAHIAGRIEPALTRLHAWPVGQRLAQVWTHWREERDAARP